MDSQPQNGDVGLGDPGASDCDASAHSEGHVIARQILDSETVGYVSSHSLTRDDVVEEDSLDGLGVRSRRQAADEGGEGAVGASSGLSCLNQ